MFACFVLLSAAHAAAGEPQDVVFQARHDRSEQRYVLVLPERFKPEDSHSVLIALHGHGSDRWQFVKDGRDECRAAREAAAKRKMIFVSPDYRAKTSWMGPAAEEDLLQILEDLRKSYRVDKVVVCGGSMGGTAALIFAALHSDLVDGVVAMNGTANLVEYDQFQEAIAASYGGSKKDKPEEYQRRSPELHAAKLKMPIAVTTGGKDRLVPPESVLRLVAALQKENRPIRSIHRPEGGHETNYADALEAFEFVFSPPLRVLLIGNSQCPTIISNQLLEKLAESDKGARPIKVGGCIKGGASLRSHWEAGTGLDSARGMITSGSWDYVVLQDIYHVEEAAFQPYARKFHELIKETSAQTVLFGTASILSDYPAGFERLHRMHVTMGKELDVSIVDASQAYFRYFGDQPSPERLESLFAKDRAHPGLWGSYLYSCGIYSVLTGRSPVGLAAPEAIPADIAKNLQETAWAQYRETAVALKR